MSKREPGAGNIKQLPNGRWRVRVTTAEGKRIGGVFATQAEAEGVRRALVAKLAEANAAPTGSMTLSAWGFRWLEERERNGMKSVYGERSIWKNRVAPHGLGKTPLAAVTRGMVRAWIQDQRDDTAKRRDKAGTLVDTGRKLHMSGVRRVRAVLRGALAAAYERELIPANPAAGIVIRGPRTEGRWTYLSKAEVDQVLSCDEIPPRFRLLYAVAIYTGLRRGELWALRWGDIRRDGPHPEIHVRGSHDGPTKTGRTRRVPLLPPALAALERLYAMAKKPDDGVLVFPSRFGKRRNKNDRGQWRANGGHPGYCVVAGITRPVSFHALRHTCASALVGGYWGPPWRLEDVQKMLGHTSIKMTERYAHLSPEYLHSRTKDTARDSVSLRLLHEGHDVQPPREIAEESATACVSIKATPITEVAGFAADSSQRVPGMSYEGHSADLDPAGVSYDLASALVRGVEAGTPTAPVIAALVALVRATEGHPLAALADAVEAGGIHRVRRALDLADALMAMADAARASASAASSASPAPRGRGGK